MLIKLFNRLVGIACMVCLMTGCSQSRDDDILRFAAEAAYPPFVYMNQDRKIIGFDAELLDMVCAEMNKTCTLQYQPLLSILPSLNAKQFDGVIGAMTVTPKRAAKVLFTDVYYLNKAAFMSRKDASLDLSNITGKRIGVQGSGTYDDYVTKVYGDKVKVVRYVSLETAALDLAANRLDAVLGDKPVLSFWLISTDQTHQFKLQDAPVDESEGYAIAVAKDNAPLQQALNVALDKIKVSQAFDDLVKKYNF